MPTHESFFTPNSLKYVPPPHCSAKRLRVEQRKFRGRSDRCGIVVKIAWIIWRTYFSVTNSYLSNAYLSVVSAYFSMYAKGSKSPVFAEFSAPNELSL